MPTLVDPKTDYVFKRVFGDEDNALILVAVLNAVLDLPTGKVVRGVTLLNPFVAQEFAEGKVPILDVRARDDPGRQYILEMQLFLRTALAKRLLYYWSGSHAEQLLKGDRYELLQPTYSICFLNETLLPDSLYHHRFRVYDDEHGVLLCKDLEMHLIELSKFDVAVDAVRTPLERWCFFLKHGASLDPAALPATMEDPQIRKALEVLMKLSRDELERHRAAERLRAQRDAAALVADARAVQEELGVAREELGAATKELGAAREELGAMIEELGSRREELGAATKELGAAREELRIAQEKARLAFEKGEMIGRIRLLQQLLKQPETSKDELRQLADDDLVKMEESLKQLWSGQKTANGTPPES